LNPPDEDLSGLRHAHGVESQAGALAYLPEADPLRFVVVTSRRTGRWVFPKGGVDPGMTAPEAARREALEEAGVIGRVADRAIGVRVVNLRETHSEIANVRTGNLTVRARPSGVRNFTGKLGVGTIQ